MTLTRNATQWIMMIALGHPASSNQIPIKMLVESEGQQDPQAQASMTRGMRYAVDPGSNPGRPHSREVVGWLRRRAAHRTRARDSYSHFYNGTSTLAP
eukprot:scaffold235166_cov18-Prasinocladus_malaysianus.AAC.2